MKQIKKKKKFKGTRYIAKVLQKYGGKKYKKYNQALIKARSVFEELKNEGTKIKVLSILDKTRKKRIQASKKPTKQKPLLYYRLSGEEPYFSLIDYPNWINLTTNEITFISDLFNEGIDEIQGGSKIDYKNTFSGFVNFGNKEVGSGKISYEELSVKTTEPEEINGKWVSKIISIDQSGTPTDFGYSPTPTPTGSAIIPPSKKVSQKTIEKQKKSEAQKIKELDLKIKKEENRKLAMQLFLENKITKKEYKDMITDINENK